MSTSRNRTINIKLYPEEQKIEETKKEMTVVETESPTSIINQSEFDWIFPEKFQQQLDDRTDADQNIDSSQTENKQFTKEITVINERIVDDQEEEANTQFKNIRATFFAKIILPVCFALIIGSAFGFFALNLVNKQTNENLQPTSMQSTANPKTDVSEKATPFTKDLTLAVVQGGVFSNMEAAEARKQQIAHTSVVFSQNDQFFIFLSIPVSLEQAKAQTQGLKQNGIDAFAKEIKINGDSAKTYSDKEKQVITQAVTNFLEVRASVDAEKAGQPIQEMHAEKITDKPTENIGAMIELNNELIELWRSRQENPQASIEKLDQKILDFVVLYQSL